MHRIIATIVALLLLGGCTAMMVGGANSGGYEPPADECRDDGDERCKGR